MPTRPKTSFWRKCRVTFRWLRILCWLLVLALLVAAIYLNQFGLPDFVKQGIVAELHQRGLDVEFEQLRWHWLHGVVGERISLSRAGRAGGPQFAVAGAEVRLDHEALKNFQWKITSVLLRDGSFLWPLHASNQPPREFKLERVTTELRFLPGDQWELGEFQGVCQGVKLNLSGTITNATRLRERRPGPAAPAVPSAPANAIEDQLRRFVSFLERIKFTGTPELTLKVSGDARPDGAWSSELHAESGRTQTPWGECARLALDGQLLRPVGSNALVNLDVKLKLEQPKTSAVQSREAQSVLQLRQSPTNAAEWRVTGEALLKDAKTRWLEAAGVKVSGYAQLQADARDHWDAHLSFNLDHPKSEWGIAAQAQASGQLAGALRRKSLATVEGEIKLAQPETRWGAASEASLTGLLKNRGTNFTRRAGAGWAHWAKMEPFELDWSAQLTQPSATNFTAQKISCAGQWRAPDLVVEKVEAELHGGKMDGDIRLNVADPQATATVNLDFDLQKIMPLLTTNTQRFLAQFSWDKPPKVNAEASVLLPPWTNRPPDWRKDFLGALRLNGHFDVGRAAYRGVPCEAAQSDFQLVNSTWHLPNLAIRRPEGTVELDYTEDIVSRDYHWGVRGSVDPKIIGPFLEEPQQRAMNFLQLTGPPRFEGDIWGQWHARERTGVRVNVALTNFVIRGEGISNFTAEVQFTNLFVRCRDLVIERGAARLTTPVVDVDIRARQIYFTNVDSTMDPMVVTRAIGPKTAAAIEPYHFHRPPKVRLNGRMPFQDIETTDLHFEVSGGPFTTMKFNLPEVSGTVHWVTNRLRLEGVRGQFYGGTAQGGALFDFKPHQGANFEFDLAVTNANLNQLVADTGRSTNKLDGLLTGRLTVTSAHTADRGSWQGAGQIMLTNGLLWEFPMFGLFSPVLNTISPGLGNSRAREATATFIITNSVIHTADMEIRSPPVHLHYAGSVDFDTRVNAVVTAELFRDAWVVGPLVNLLTKPLTKIFEYKVTGTLHQPKSEPLYVPKLLLFPLHPFRTLKDIFTPDDAAKPRPEDKPPAREQK